MFKIYKQYIKLKIISILKDKALSYSKSVTDCANRIGYTQKHPNYKEVPNDKQSKQISESIKWLVEEKMRYYHSEKLCMDIIRIVEEI